MRIETKYLRFENRSTISSTYDFYVTQHHSDRRCCVSQTTLQWFEVLLGRLQALQGVPRFVVSSARIVIDASGLDVGTPRCSKACHQRFHLLAGAPRCTQSLLRPTEVFSNLLQSLPLYCCMRHQSFQLLRRPAGMPSQGLILSWIWHLKVYTPHPLRHSWRIPVTKIHIADEDLRIIQLASCQNGITSCQHVSNTDDETCSL